MSLNIAHWAFAHFLHNQMVPACMSHLLVYNWVAKKNIEKNSWIKHKSFKNKRLTIGFISLDFTSGWTAWR